MLIDISKTIVMTISTADQAGSKYLHCNPGRIKRVLQHEPRHLPRMLRLCIAGDLCGKAEQVAGEVLLLELLELLLCLVAGVAVWALRAGQYLGDIGSRRHHAPPYLLPHLLLQVWELSILGDAEEKLLKRPQLRNGRRRFALA